MNFTKTEVQWILNIVSGYRNNRAVMANIIPNDECAEPYVQDYNKMASLVEKLEYVVVNNVKHITVEGGGLFD